MYFLFQLYFSALFNYSLYIFIFYNSLLIFTLFIHSYKNAVSIYIIISLNSLLGRLLISILLNSFSDILFCSLIQNTFLCLLILSKSLCLFLVLRRLIMFPNLGEVALCRKLPTEPSSTFSSDYQSYTFQGYPL